ncbi:MAG: ribonucleoside hydrolase RihC [Eubacteriales bacterium]|nr:ribonucleoside hydrolase RihC [Eubacteriales bacterium]
MDKRKVIIDTDPGIDDAVALALAIYAESIDVQLITTVCGNVNLEKVSLNALKLLKFFDSKIPVAKGAAEPLIEPYSDAAAIHGESGLRGFEGVELAEENLLDQHAVLAMAELLKASSEKVTIMALGPLTNIALLLKLFPEIKEQISEIVFMGGSLTRGNKGVMSEFNIATDPEAAKIVFDSGLPLTMISLDIGHQARIELDDINALKELGKVGQMLYSLFVNYRSGSIDKGLNVYDACASAYLLKPELFASRLANLDVELAGLATRGCTVVDLDDLTEREANANICTEVDGRGFRKWFLDCIAQAG